MGTPAAGEDDLRGGVNGGSGVRDTMVEVAVAVGPDFAFVRTDPAEFATVPLAAMAVMPSEDWTASAVNARSNGGTPVKPAPLALSATGVAVMPFDIVALHVHPDHPTYLAVVRTANLGASGERAA